MNYSEKFTKIMGRKKNICFRDAPLNVGNLFVSVDFEDKGQLFERKRFYCIFVNRHVRSRDMSAFLQRGE